MLFLLEIEIVFSLEDDSNTLEDDSNTPAVREAKKMPCALSVAWKLCCRKYFKPGDF